MPVEVADVAKVSQYKIYLVIVKAAFGLFFCYGTSINACFSIC